MRPQWITLNIKVAEKASNMRIAVLGECYVELSHYPLCQTIGGDDFHIAVYLARLGQYKHTIGKIIRRFQPYFPIR